MKKDYEQLWIYLVNFIQAGEGDKARKIWDEVVEDAWKYNDLND